MKGVVPAHACALAEAPWVPKRTDRVIAGLADILEKEYLPNASESPGPVLLGFHIWSVLDVLR